MSKSAPSIMMKVWELETRVEGHRALIRDLTACLENRNRQLKACCESIETLVQTLEQILPNPRKRGVAGVILFQAQDALANAFEGSRASTQEVRHEAH